MLFIPEGCIAQQTSFDINYLWQTIFWDCLFNGQLSKKITVTFLQNTLFPSSTWQKRSSIAKPLCMNNIHGLPLLSLPPFFIKLNFKSNFKRAEFKSRFVLFLMICWSALYLKITSHQHSISLKCSLEW